VRSTWFSARALGLHATIIVVVPGFLYLGWWQLHRALAGNDLSWAYTVEWPFFCVYAVFVWWKLIHDIAADRATGPRALAAPLQTVLGPRPLARPPADAAVTSTAATPVPTTSEADDRADEELATYNLYLASLERQSRRDRR
jgi:hypothetical protein